MKAKRFLNCILLGVIAELIILSASCSGKDNKISMPSGGNNSVSDIISRQMQEENPLYEEYPLDEEGYYPEEDAEAEDYVDIVSEILKEKEWSSQRLASLAEWDKLKVDIDFSQMNFIVAQGQVFDMMLDAQSYNGMTTKINGKFVSQESPYGRTYAALYYDATACCQTGLSFIINGGLVFPKDYPAEMEDIAIYGTIRVAQIQGMEFMYVEVEKYFFE